MDTEDTITPDRACPSIQRAMKPQEAKPRREILATLQNVSTGMCVSCSPTRLTIMLTPSLARPKVVFLVSWQQY